MEKKSPLTQLEKKKRYLERKRLGISIPRSKTRRDVKLQRKMDKVKKYGLTVEQFDEMMKAQKNKCAVCHKRETKRHPSGTLFDLAIDHDHKTGKVRGLLCNSCNRALGNLMDSTDNAHSVINYLRDANKIEHRDVVFVDKGTPEWLKTYCKRMYSFLDLQVFSVQINYASHRAINRRLREIGYAPILKTDLAAAVIDPTYLTAHLFFPSPMFESYEAKATIAHEFLHIDFRYHIFDKVKLALSGLKTKDDAKLLRIEEEAVENTLSILEKVGLFN